MTQKLKIPEKIEKNRNSISAVALEEEEANNRDLSNDPSIKSLDQRITKLEEDIKNPKTFADFAKNYQWFFYIFISIAAFFGWRTFEAYTKHFEQMKENVNMQIKENEKRTKQRLDYIEERQEILIENKINSSSKTHN
jgi:hypothetical protein